MKTKKDIVDNWLPRYTGRELKDFSKYILLTNFEYYLELFSELYQVPIVGADKTMPNVSCNGLRWSISVWAVRMPPPYWIYFRP